MQDFDTIQRLDALSEIVFLSFVGSTKTKHELYCMQWTATVQWSFSFSFQQTGFRYKRWYIFISKESVSIVVFNSILCYTYWHANMDWQ